MLLFKIVSPYLITPREIRELNNNSNLPYKFISPIEEFDEEGWEKELGYNEVKYVDSREDYIMFNGYPDLSNSYKLTYLSIDDPEFSLFGICVGNNMTFVDSIMKKNGYRRKTDDYEYYKGKIHISLATDRIKKGDKVMETLRAFIISIRSSDWFRKGYYK
ncbi:hypothetical protein [Anaerocolumna sp.]|uniref:hypothetical protein n=1 Tax=Anaerocolumna sp. TaxID=2041569 RepID=UPI0028B128BE|nr:hypothetical protein [Anaerocolumna sp.]